MTPTADPTPEYTRAISAAAPGRTSDASLLMGLSTELDPTLTEKSSERRQPRFTQFATRRSEIWRSTKLAARIDRFRFEGEHAEHALVNSVQRLTGDKTVEGFDAEGELAQRERSLVTEPPSAQAFEVPRVGVFGSIDDVEIVSTGEVHVWRTDRDELLAIRDGALSYEELIAESETLQQTCDRAVAESTLPHAPDLRTIEDLCIDLIERELADARS